MKNKNTIRPKTKTTLRLRNIFLFTAGGLIISGLVWKFIIGTSATVASSGDVFGMYTPANGPQITGYAWEKVITVDHTKVADTVDLVNFPLLVSFTDIEFKSIAYGGNVESEFGYDILFTGANGAQLQHQIESYDPSTGNYVAWVNLPILYHNVDTELKITYGNSSLYLDPSDESLWDANYEAVWHMAEDPTGAPLNDGAGQNNAQSYGSMNSADLISGAIGPAIELDGSNDYFAINNKFYTNPGEITAMTVSGWVKTTFHNNSWTSNWSILDFDRSEYFNFFVHGQGKISFCTRGQNGNIHDFHAGQTGQINDGEWHYVVGSYDGTNKYLYIDGVLVNTSTNSHGGANIGSGTNRYGFLGEGSEANCFNGSRNGKYYRGSLDEIRLSKIQRTTGWITTEFNNQSSPSTFFTFGTPINMPIELAEFDAQLDEDEVLVTWVTATELNNDYFTIERSVDATEFEKIGEVQGAGTSQEKLDYEFYDTDPILGLSYYRLRQTDYDGKSETFTPVSVNYSKKVDAVEINNVSPNPFTNTFKVKYTLSTSSAIEITLTNTAGNQIFRDVTSGEEGTNEYTFYPTVDLNPGLYFLNIIQNGEVRASTKVKKQ